MFISSQHTCLLLNLATFYCATLVGHTVEGMGAYGPLLLDSAEGLGGPLGPLTCGGDLFS